MNIKILDSWLREYVKTKATPQQIAEKLSLTSVSIERMEKYKNDIVYDIEVTTNRPDLMSVVGLAREAAAILPQFGIPAKFTPPILHQPAKTSNKKRLPLKIINDPKLVSHLCAVVMEVHRKATPQTIKDRLESSDIRSLNNIVDITNYIMRALGQPTHVMDYDRLGTTTLHIRESKKGEKITTLDGKQHSLPGWDIVADDGKGNIIDLVGIMGLQNSVITEDTKRILLFIQTTDANRIRRTSMATAIRTEAATINEKDLDTELAYQALIYGIQLYQELADGQVISDIIDSYPNKPKSQTVTVPQQKINQIIGVEIPPQRVQQILQSLGFKVESTPNAKTYKVLVPSWRQKDITIAEDIVEEIARVYGYHNIPNMLPPVQNSQPLHMNQNDFYWETRIKNACKYWGFTETYTNSMVSQDMFQGPIENAVAIQNPLTKDMAYMMNRLGPSLLQVAQQNKTHEEIKIFEIGNIYQQTTDLPAQITHLAGLIKKNKLNFFEVKGLLEQLASDLGITKLKFELETNNTIVKVVILSDKPQQLGEIHLLQNNLITFELNLQTLLSHATLKKIYTLVSKFPAVYEDISVITSPEVTTEEIIMTIQTQSPLITHVNLLDRYQTTRTFHITYQSQDRNLTSEEVGEIRTKILNILKDRYTATIK